jgi:hypothetical protein
MASFSPEKSHFVVREPQKKKAFHHLVKRPLLLSPERITSLL